MTNLSDAARALGALLQDRQHDRILRLRFPHDDGPSALMVANGLDAFESISRDFAFTVEVLCDDARIALKDVQGKMVTIELVREDGTLRWFNGYVFEFRLTRTDGAQAFYSMLLRPWMSYLALRKDNYLFHGKSLYQQSDEIFRDYELSDWQTRVTGPDEAMTDACQFDESDYNYLHRRWEAAGWHYWYEHRADGHTLVLSDDSTAAEPIDGLTSDIPWQAEAGSLEDDAISDWTPVRRIMPAKVSISSFDFKVPRPRASEVPSVNRQGDVLPLEVYEYGGAYGFKDSGSAAELARRRMEEIESRGKHFEAGGNDRFAAPRRWFRLTGHFDGELFGDDAQREFLILHVRHVARNNYLQSANAPAQYRNMFACIRRTIPWRPGRNFNSTEPKIYGLQTAIVVGPKGQEIHTDQYGRIRVQFHWDRIGQYDERSSAWIRVSQPWAGKDWGAIAIPRIGQEVVVQFLDGNPDRPMVTGSLFNADQMPPYALPGGDHMMGFKSNSTPGGGGYCEMVIHDAKGNELINIHSQKDMVTTVQHNKDTIVNGPHQTTKVTTGFQETTVKRHIKVESTSDEITIKAATRITLECGASKIVMDREGNITVTGKTITSIASAEHVVIGAPLKLNPSAAPAAPAAVAAPGSPAGPAAALLAASASSAPKSGPSGKTAGPFVTGLGSSVDALAGKSPSLQADLRELDKAGWSMKYGKAGSGSYVDRGKSTITIDSDEKGKPALVVQTLAHEVGHATYPYAPDYASKEAYVNGALADEGAATLNNIKVQREILAAKGADIGIAGNPDNHPVYKAAYDKFVVDGNAAAARDAIGKQFGSGEISSVEVGGKSLNYSEYYGSFYGK